MMRIQRHLKTERPRSFPSVSPLARCQRALRMSAWDRYLALLKRVVSDHAHMPEVAEIRDLLSESKWLEVYRASDKLSKQKYDSAALHFAAGQIALLIKKYPFPADKLDLKPQDAAVSTFDAAERRCGRVNTKFRLLRNNPGRDKFAKEAGAARFWIRSVIGSHPNYKAVFRDADFGPGASVGVHGNATSYTRKIAEENWTVTPGALHHGYAAIRSNFHIWETLLERKNGLVCYDEEYAFAAYLRKVTMVHHNKICFVPKTAKTDRTIAVEPLLNSLVQKGIDAVLRRKLLSAGIDLTDQEKSGTYAREGSLDTPDGFVTIDLSSASDSVTVELARSLLPDDWFRLLWRTRSPSYMLGDRPATGYHKMCSMGNGFCFPLETLIFAAACVAVGGGVPGKDFLVYGDDIIVRKPIGAKVIDLLRHWGFKTNADKTFLEGPFRESCGQDWFGGKDVRPFTLDFALDSLEAIFKFLNLTRQRERTTQFFSPYRELILADVPRRFQFFRPLPGPVDTGIDSTGDEHLYCPSCRFVGGRWQWSVLSHYPVTDKVTLERVRDQPWLISEALRGARSIRNGVYCGLPEVTLRNNARTKVTRESYSATSNWLPTPSSPWVRATVGAAR